jgi:NitT/TauT family transport system substrate-binding protein
MNVMHRSPALAWLAVLVTSAVLASGCGSAVAPAASGSSAPAAGPSSAAASAAPAVSAPPATAKPSASSAAPAKAAEGTIKIAWTQPAAAYVPLWLAQDNGYFKKYGLDTEALHLAPPSDTQALISGDVQMVIGGTGGISAIAGGANLTFIGVTVPVYLQSLYGQPSIQKFSDLAGKSIGATTQGGPSDFALRTVLKKEGVHASAVKIVYLRDDATVLAALKGGSIQAAIITSPNTLQAQKAGLRLIEDMIPLKLHTITQGIYVRKDWAQQHQPALESVLKGYLEAVKQSRADAAGAKTTISKWTKVEDPVLLDESYKTTISGLAAYPLVHDEDVQNVIDLSTEASVKAHKPADFYDNSYLQGLDGFVKGLYPAGVPSL